MTLIDISLYGIVDPARSRERDWAKMAADAATAGATLIQYRDKTASTRTMVSRARGIRKALTGCVPFIVNDRVDVALASGAAGVHLGADDMLPTDARRLLGDAAIVGLSIKTLEEARTVPLGCADYAFVGGVFETDSKDNPQAVGLAGWQARAQIVRERAPELPVGAIAGIDRTNAASLIEAGADGIAVISALFMADDVTEAAGELRQIIDVARHANAA